MLLKNSKNSHETRNSHRTIVKSDLTGSSFHINIQIKYLSISLYKHLTRLFFLNHSKKSIKN